MSLFRSNLFGMISLCLFLFLSINTSTAQASKCDPCNDPWVSAPQKVYSNQTVQGLSPNCTFNIYLTIETRICNGIPQVRLVDYYIESNNGSGCLIACWHVGLLMRKATKLLLQDLGGHIVVNKPASCYYVLEFDPTPQFKACVGKEINYFPKWYQVIPCGKSCCVTEYELQATGEVKTLSSNAEPCMGTPPAVIPSTITVYCSGVPMIVPVIPPTQPLTCEPTCDNTGDIFSAKIVGTEELDIENVDRIYPNPAGSIINVSNWKKWTDVQIYDATGKLVLKSKMTKIDLDISKLPQGYYQMMLSNEENDLRSVQKFVKE